MEQQVYFSKNVRYLTNHTIISQSELSRILGISRQAIHRLITNNADCRISTVIKISEVFNMSPNDLLFVDFETKYKNANIHIKNIKAYKKSDNDKQ